MDCLMRVITTHFVAHQNQYQQGISTMKVVNLLLFPTTKESAIAEEIYVVYSLKSIGSVTDWSVFHYELIIVNQL